MKQDPFDRLLAELREKYGEKVAAPASSLAPIERLSTGVPPLDEITGGGWPKGRVVEIWGPRSVGKSTLVLASLAAAQRAHPTKERPAVLFDQENTFEATWARTLGVDLNRLTYVPPMAGEDVGDLVLQYIRRQVPVIAIDSVIAMVPEKALVKGTGEHTYAPVAGLLSTWLPKVVVLQGLSPTVLLLVNQVRDKIGFMFGETTKSPGGRTLEHADSIKLKVWRRSKTKEPGVDADGKKTDIQVGYVMAVQVVKSKVGNEGRETRLQVRFDRGILDTAVPDSLEEEIDE